MVQSDADLNTVSSLIIVSTLFAHIFLRNFVIQQIRMNLMSGETRDKIFEKCEFDLWPMSVQTFNNLVLVWVGKMLN